MKLQPKTLMTGFISINKKSGDNSTAAVNKIKWLTGKPCGHMGTLDPLASGVLPVGIGNATRLFDYFLSKVKEYVAEFTFGMDSDTLDNTGKIIYGGRIPSKEEILSIIPALCGEVMQVPPNYSAKNIDGRRGYDLAREGVEFTLPPKKVSIFAIELLGKGCIDNSFSFRIQCGAGTYIRSIARDMGELLNTKAVMSSLIRTKSGSFTIENSVKLEDLTEDNFENYIIPTEEFLPFNKIVFLETDRIFNGIPACVQVEDGDYKAYRGSEFYGIATVKSGIAKIKTKLC